MQLGRRCGWGREIEMDGCSKLGLKGKVIQVQGNWTWPQGQWRACREFHVNEWNDSIQFLGGSPKATLIMNEMRDTRVIVEKDKGISFKQS